MAVYPMLPIAMTLGLLANFIGLFTWCYALYKGIPFVGETLNDRERQPVSGDERQRLQGIARVGIFLVIIGHVVMGMAFWCLAYKVFEG